MRKQLKIHSAAKIIPNMSADQFLELKEDIKAFGLREPIWTKDGAILDGRNRYRACLELDIEPQFREFTGDDAVMFVLSTNLRRRHLSARQRRTLIRKYLQESPDRSNRQIAADLGVSPTTVGTVRATVQFGQSARQPAKRKPHEVRGAALITHEDLQFHRFFKFVLDLTPEKLTDASEKIQRLRAQCDRLSSMIGHQEAV